MVSFQYEDAIGCFLEAMQVMLPAAAIWNDMAECYMI